jgi:hypothetical protein
MKVKNLKITLPFTNSDGKHEEFTLDQYDYLNLLQENGFDVSLDMEGMPFTVENGQHRIEIKAWKGMKDYEDLKQG